MKPCLLVIDMLQDFLERLPRDEATRLVEATNGLCAAFRARALPVIWVRQAFEADLSDAFLEMRDKGLSVTIRGTPGADPDPRLDRAASDLEVVKKRYSAFFGTPLDAILADLGVDHLVLAGVNIHACVRTTAIDAYQRDLRVMLAREALGGSDPEHAAISLRYMDGKIGRVLSNAEIVDLLPG